MDWWSQAVCATRDPEIWFSMPIAAKRYCETCPVAKECLEDALNTPQEHDNFGIRAGLSASARRRLRKVNDSVVN